MPTVMWYSKGKDITRDPRTEIDKVRGGYIMRLGPVHPFFDNGTLECRGKNGVDPPVSDKAELRVLRKPFGKLSTAKSLIFTWLFMHQRCVRYI